VSTFTMVFYEFAIRYTVEHSLLVQLVYKSDIVRSGTTVLPKYRSASKNCIS
jgi:hypothetical protein